MKKEKNSKKAAKAVLLLAMAGILFVPMLYSVVYLGAIWDAYGEVKNVPVAFINSDQPCTKDGKQYFIGADLENNLKDNDKVDWNFVDRDTAMSGLEGTDYYAVIEVPSDFSEKIANAKDGDFSTPELVYTSNKGRNFIFSQISEKIANSLKAEVASSIQKEVSKALVNSLYDVKVSIKDAGDGASELASGQQKLLDGSLQLQEGTQQAASGSAQLGSGLYTAAASSAKLQDGASQLLKGSSAISAGINSVEGGSKQLQDGLANMASGESGIAGGSAALVDGLVSLKAGLTQQNGQLPLLLSGASDLDKNAAALAQGAEQLDSSLNTGLNSLADGVGRASDAIGQSSAVLNSEVENIRNSDLSQEDKDRLIAAIAGVDTVDKFDMSSSIEAPLREAAGSAKPLADNLKLLSQGASKVSSGFGQLASALQESQSKAAAGIDQLIGGAKAIQLGSSSLLDGLNTAAGKTGEIAGGLGKLESASTAVTDGLDSVTRGSAALTDGLSTADVKTGELTSGLQALKNGTEALSSGLTAARDGADKLRDGLASGYSKLSGNLSFSSEGMSNYISDPVSLKVTSMNDVKCYGEGFAPYFASLSLWIGTMLMSLAFSIGKKFRLFRSRFMNSFAGAYAAGAALAVVQAAILSAALLVGLGIKPLHLQGFIAGNIFISVVFFSIMYGVSNAIGIFGAPVMFIVLLLQLASSGGTFPIETAPMFYKVVNHIIPMTYSVNLLRAVISGANSVLLGRDAAIMMAFMTAAMAGGILIRTAINAAKRQNKRKIRAAGPEAA
jgi:putative membrane protein